MCSVFKSVLLACPFRILEILRYSVSTPSGKVCLIWIRLNFKVLIGCYALQL